ncbi:MAG: hypothetical protein NZ480_06020 [Bdellovibrionaceae bacterium]|nr:hypothetical protein [Pseudobdellovibrionaceae bacterium]MDW8190589.1 hypothetical protein [Pseudobdellovibrionaceae bacterium]
MKSNKKQNLPNWVVSGHSKPKTRREFLAQGLIPFVASTFLPNPIQLLTSNEFIESAWGNLNCPSAASNSWIPFIQVDLAGGAALMANVVPMDQGGQMLPSYSIMGLGGRPNIISVFGNTPFYTASGLLAGINAQTTDVIRNNVSVFNICVQSGDDRTSNLMAMNGIVQALGNHGQYLPPTGNTNSATTGRHRPAIIEVNGPLFVNNFNAISSSLNYSGALGALSQPQREKLAKLAKNLNSSQARKLAQSQNISVLNEIVGCAGIKNEEVVISGSNAVDPRQNADMQRIWGINANTAPNTQALVFAALVFNALRKTSGPATITLGGYDYHGNPRNVTDARDNEAGQLIGRIIASAAALNTPVFIALTSDGSVSSVNSDNPGSNFTSDRGSAGSMIGFIYHPRGRVNLRNTQLGYFEQGQLASERSIVGGSTERAVGGMILNYLALNNRVGDFEKIARSMFTTSEIDQLILIS